MTNLAKPFMPGTNCDRASPFLVTPASAGVSFYEPFLPANHLAVQRGDPVLVVGRSRNIERLRTCTDLLFEEDVAIEVHEPEHASSLALDGNPVVVESVEVQSRYFQMVSDGVSPRI